MLFCLFSVRTDLTSHCCVELVSIWSHRTKKRVLDIGMDDSVALNVDVSPLVHHVLVVEVLGLVRLVSLMRGLFLSDINSFSCSRVHVGGRVAVTCSTLVLLICFREVRYL
jgi:hypothetical protein